VSLSTDGVGGPSEVTGGFLAARVGKVSHQATLRGQVGEAGAPGNKIKLKKKNKIKIIK
jgi:hypothetical protein